MMMINDCAYVERSSCETFRRRIIKRETEISRQTIEI